MNRASGNVLTEIESDEDRFRRARLPSSPHDLSTVPWESWAPEPSIDASPATAPPDVGPTDSAVDAADALSAPAQPSAVEPPSDTADLDGLAEVPWPVWALDHPCEAEHAEEWLRSAGPPPSVTAPDVEQERLAPPAPAPQDRATITPWMVWALDHPCEAERAEAWLDDVSAAGEVPASDSDSSESEVATSSASTRRRTDSANVVSRWRRTGSAIVTTVLVIALVGVVFLSYGNVNNRWYQLVTVQGGSMEPTYSIGDVLVLTRPPDRIEVGMVLTMQVEGSVVTHRVVGVADDGTFFTQGDANDFPDDFGGLDVRVVGQVRGALPWIGKFLGHRASTNAWFTDRRTTSAAAAAAGAFGSENAEDTSLDASARVAAVPTVENVDDTVTDDTVTDDTVTDDTVTDDTVTDDTVTDDTVTDDTSPPPPTTDDTSSEATPTDVLTEAVKGSDG